MAAPRVGTTQDGKPMHYSVGALIARDGRYLLIKRRSPPPGWACPAGHIDEGESPEEAIRREVREEVGLTVVDADLVFEEFLDWNDCSKDVTGHYWYVFRCAVEGKPHRSLLETKGMRWSSPDSFDGLALEDVWAYWFEKLDLL